VRQGSLRNRRRGTIEAPSPGPVPLEEAAVRPRLSSKEERIGIQGAGR